MIVTYHEDGEGEDSSAHKLCRLSGNMSNGSFGANELIMSHGGGAGHNNNYLQQPDPCQQEPQSSTSLPLFAAKGISQKKLLSKNKSQHGRRASNDRDALGFSVVGGGIMNKATSHERQQQSQESLKCFSMLSDLSGHQPSKPDH